MDNSTNEGNVISWLPCHQVNFEKGKRLSNWLNGGKNQNHLFIIHSSPLLISSDILPVTCFISTVALISIVSKRWTFVMHCLFPFAFLKKKIRVFGTSWVDRLYENLQFDVYSLFGSFWDIFQRLSFTIPSMSWFNSCIMVGSLSSLEGSLSTVFFGDKGPYVCHILFFWIHQWKHLNILTILNPLKTEICLSFVGPKFPIGVSKIRDKDLFK